MNRHSLPTEDEQYQSYREVVETSLPGYATIRTLDLGGDKLADFVSVESEDNPVMGLRAVRFCLAHREIFKVQARSFTSKYPRTTSRYGPTDIEARRGTCDQIDLQAVSPRA